MPASAADSGHALERLKRREEVLEICFWYRGEGFGDVFTAGGLMPFLAADLPAVRCALEELVGEGHLQASEHGYAFTAAGRRKAGRLFAESFVDFQRPAHGECEGDCCGEDDHGGEHEHHHHHPHSTGTR